MLSDFVSNGLSYWNANVDTSEEHVTSSFYHVSKKGERKLREEGVMW